VKEKGPEEDHPGAALGRKSPAEGCLAPARGWHGGAEAGLTTNYWPKPGSRRTEARPLRCRPPHEAGWLHILRFKEAALQSDLLKLSI